MRADAHDRIGRQDLAAADRRELKELISKPKQQNSLKKAPSGQNKMSKTGVS
jgi:hypothetical protein